MFINLIVITVVVNLSFFLVNMVRKIDPTLFGTWWNKTTKYLVIINFTMLVLLILKTGGYHE